MTIPISSYQAAILGCGAIVEKFAERPQAVRFRVVPKSIRPFYENILTAILLYDDVATITPNIEPCNLSCLEDKYGLISRIEISDNDSCYQRVLTSYERGFCAFRRQEMRLDQVTPRITRSGFSVARESLGKQLNDIQDEEHIAQAFENCVNFPRSILQVLQLAHNIEFEASWTLLANVFSDYLGDHKSILDFGEKKASVREHMSDVLKRLPFHLGLYLDEERVARERGGELTLFNFDPARMRTLFETETVLASSRGDIENHMQQGLLLAFRQSPAKFLACQTLWRTVFEFQRMLRHATEHNTQLLASIPIRKPEKGRLTEESVDERVRAYRLVSENLPSVPRISSISELLRLRDDPHLPALRNCISAWASSMRLGDGRSSLQVAKDISAASKSLDTARRLQLASQAINYITIPISIAEALAGTCFGLTLLPIGPCLDLAASRLVKNNSWIQFGIGRS